ncbi:MULTISPECIES: GH32 C-terminal domain-containing protein [unclassified Rathayibacter]|uniref:GH32 C-terminal domain-containing protein n=1 Tax=unclassified Rathayibacter TaxID=2609250 RepID=UPI002158509F|nr:MULTISPECIES: GH32 C-terminal domain-containing protein [unclassified Rathayibacter]
MLSPHRSLPRRSGLVAVAAALCLVGGGLFVPAVSAAPLDAAAETYRPAIHYSPTKNWMNDPNGLVYYEGVYHLYYQYNPQGTRWGNMSWGHATSTDLTHWTEQPLAIPGDAESDIFSGSIVVDKDNTSGFGTAENPPLVAMYTAAYKTGEQAQALAYSTDAGQTWTKYEGNPVIDRDQNDFRDPHVFWYDGGTPESSYWVVVTVEADDHKVLLHKSTDLRNWTELSEFGPANATGGVWECPDLFPLAVDGDPSNIKWVMVVNLNPGAVGGGSGGQYFVGDFDGTTFTSESTVGSDTLPEGTTLAGFDDGTYNGWTVDNEPGNGKNGPFGSAPATGPIDGQQTVTGFSGTGLINGFNDGDWPVGSMESPDFTVDQDHLNFLAGGGNHPHVDGTQLANDPPAGSELLFEGFEFPDQQGLADNGWTVTGDLAGGTNPSTSGGEFFLGQKRINTFDGGPKGDDNLGTLTSPEFTIDKSHLSMLVGGGFRPEGDAQTLEVQLVVDGEVVQTTAGTNDGALNWKSWDVSAYQGKAARIVVVDDATGGWGHLTVDHIVLADTPAQVRSNETSVNLVVDGEIVRTATGSDSETLDWKSWDVADLAGRTAHLQVVDNNRAGWGHILADQFMLSDEPAQSRLVDYDWLDWGRDYYAGVTFDNAPDDKRIMIAWMNNWQYGEAIPTGTWRGAMALPRELSLETVDGAPKLVQKVVDQTAALERGDEAFTLGATDIADGETALPAAAEGSVYKLDAVFSAGDADSFGLSVRNSADGSQRTPITYDVASGQLSVDRTRSGDVGFDADFPSVETAPVALDDGELHLELYVDHASVETFAQGGRATITDQVFPDPSSTGVSLLSSGGTARLESLTVTPLTPSMFTDPAAVASLTPAGAAQTVETGAAITGLGVTAANAAGEPVAGADVAYTIEGPARFADGGTTAAATTGADGSAPLPAATAGPGTGAVSITAVSGGVSRLLPAVTVVAPATRVDVDVTITGVKRGGSVVLTATATNEGSTPVRLSIPTAFGELKVASLAAGRTKTVSVDTHLSRVPSGSFRVTATAPDGTRETFRVAYRGTGK